MGEHKNKKSKYLPGTIKNLPKNSKPSFDKDSELFRNTGKKCSWKDRVMIFLSNPRVAVITTIVSIVIGLVTAIQWCIPNKNAPSIAVAMRSYEHGLIALEDGELKEAREYFEKAYNLENNLLDVKYYYAYTEYLLKNYDESYKILQRNRISLNPDEMALYAMYEMKNGNVERCKEYLDKISEPEKLKNFSFRAYVVAATQLGFSISYEPVFISV